LKLYYEVYGDLGKSRTAPLLLIPRGFPIHRLDAAFGGGLRCEAFGDCLRSTGARSNRGHVAEDVLRAVRRRRRGIAGALKVEHADVMGYSQGGGAALQLALHHPTLVNKLVVLSATYREDGWYPARSKALEGLNAKALAGSPFEGAFKKHTPDPRAFEAYVEKMKVLNINYPNIADAQRA